MAGSHHWSKCVCLQSYWYGIKYYKSMSMKDNMHLDYPYLSLPDVDEEAYPFCEHKMEKKVQGVFNKQI